MSKRDIPSQEEKGESILDFLASLDPREIEAVKKNLELLSGKIDRSKINIKELGEGAEVLILLFTGKITGEIDPKMAEKMVVAVAAIEIVVGYLIIAGGADVAPTKTIPRAVEVLKKKFQKTEVYKEKISPAKDRVIDGFDSKRDRLAQIREKYKKR